MSYTHLTLEERYVIYHLVLYGLSLREIGRWMILFDGFVLRSYNENQDHQRKTDRSMGTNEKARTHLADNN